MKKKIYFCNSFEQLPTAIGLVNKYQDTLIITPSIDIFNFLKKIDLSVKKIEVVSKVIRPNFILRDLKNWFQPNSYEKFYKKDYEIFFSSYCDDLAFISFLKKCQNEPIYIPLTPKREIEKLSKINIFKSKQLIIQFIFSIFFYRIFFDILSVDSEIFLGHLPNKITKKKITINFELNELQIKNKKIFNLKLTKFKNPIFLLGYTYDNDVKYFGKKILDRFLDDIFKIPNSIIKIHPGSNLEKYVSNHKHLSKLKKKDQLNSDIPVELILPYSREVRILGSRVSLLFAKKGINVFFYTALLNKKISNLDSYNLSLINKLSKFDNVKLIRL